MAVATQTGAPPLADPPSAPASDPLRAALWMAGAIGSFTALAVAGRAVGPAHDTFEIMLYRSIIGRVLVLAIARSTGRWGEIRRGPMHLHALRNIGHFAGQNLWFYAITVAPLAQVFALEFTTPIWVLLLSPLLLGERITRRGLVAALIGFCGIVVVAQPGTTLSPGLLAAALCALGFALSAIFTKLLTRTEPMTAILFWLNLMQLAMSLAIAGADGDIALPGSAAIPWLGLIGLAGLFAHFCLTRALQLAPAAIVMPMDFLRLPVIALIGVAVYDEALSLALVGGGMLILIGNWVNLRRG